MYSLVGESLLLLTNVMRHGGKVAERFPDHPASIWLREDVIAQAVAGFFSERIFGADRRACLEANLDQVDVRAESSRLARLNSLRRAIGDIAVRQDRLVLTIESQDDPTGAVFGRVRDRLGELEAKRRAKEEELTALESEMPIANGGDADLLDLLPVVDVDLLTVPCEFLRPLFEAFRLQIRYDRPGHHATIQVTIAEEALDTIETAIDSAASGSDRNSDVRPHRRQKRSHVLGAPGRNRTCAHGSGNRCSIL